MRAIGRRFAILSVLLTALSTVSCAGGGAAEAERSTESVSGTLNAGLRIVPIDQVKKGFSHAVYRGDYVVLEFSDGGTRRVVIPELDIDTTMPRPAGESSYLKFAEEGTFETSIDGAAGTITVLAYAGSSYREISAIEASELIENIEPFILDVRTPAEYAAGHIEGATLIPVQVLADRIGEIHPMKDEPIFLYCQSGNRSTVAAKILIDAGFTNVYNLGRGINEWRGSRLPLSVE